MPHVVFGEKIDLQSILEKFTPIFQNKPHLIKIQEIFLDKQKRKMLLSTVVIDERHQEFLIEVLSNEQKTTIRLFPKTDPEKTDGVKSALGLVSNFIQKVNPSASITKTNIEDFIPK